MADDKNPQCPRPTCGVPLVLQGFTGPVGGLDDPSPKQWRLFVCPSCDRNYLVDRETGAIREPRDE